MFTERSVGRVEAGALVSQSCKHQFIPCLVMPKILEISIHSVQHLKNRGVSSRSNIDKWQRLEDYMVILVSRAWRKQIGK